MVRKEGKIPCNARVDIDYTGKKPKIKFGYTSKNPKKDVLKQHYYNFPLLILLVLLWVFPYLFMQVYIVNSSYPSNCSVVFDEHYINMSWYTDVDGKNHTFNNYKKWVSGMNITCDNNTIEYSFNKHHSLDEKASVFKPKNNYHLKFTLIFVFYLFVIAPLLIHFINKLVIKWLLKQKWYVKSFPERQAKGKIKKYYKFKPKDVLENVIIIPKFNNVVLDYKTKGDFSKYLEKIKIREYRWRKINTKKNKISKEEVDNYKWYAIFYFKQKPKTGYLEVIYK